jgi:tRNA A37 threonylcarbamoyladenosine dehydratase
MNSTVSTTQADSVEQTQSAPEIDENYKLHRRFDRIGRLVGDHGMAKLFGSRVAVIGLGGVGSFAAESLVRSGIGTVDLVDFDLVCITNSNRQLQAMKGTIGKSKAEVLAQRMEGVNPKAVVNAVQYFYNDRTSEKLLHPEGQPLDFVVDAIDNVTAKCHLLATCKQLGIPVVTSTGASGRWDPTAISVQDLGMTMVDPLARDVRKILRTQYGFPDGKKKKFGIPAVVSSEEPGTPLDLTYDNGEGFRCVCPGGSNGMHSCEKRSVIYGTASFVTGTFGLVCASVVVKALAGPG